MVAGRAKKISRVLLAVMAVQLLLPLLILLATMSVRIYQEYEISVLRGKGGLQQIVVSASEVSESKLKEGEICYHGEMYDIAGYSYSNGHYVVSVLADGTETGLQRLKARGEPSPSATNSTLQVLPFFFLFHESYASWQPLYPAVATQRTAEHRFTLPTRARSIVTPPPRRAC